MEQHQTEKQNADMESQGGRYYSPFFHFIPKQGAWDDHFLSGKIF